MTLHTVVYGDSPIEFQLCHLPRPHRRVAIHVHPCGSVKVDAPAGAQLGEIKLAVLKRARWVLKHVQQAHALRTHTSPRQYVSGESHFYLGRCYKLKVITDPEQRASVKLLRGCLEVRTSAPTPEKVKHLLWEWYREHAREVFQQRMAVLITKITWLETAPPWKLLTMTKQWGSCSPKGMVSLNPHLVKAPRECIDYVILHELCHLQEHNHSPRFYRLLFQVMPGWEVVKVRLDGMAEVVLGDCSIYAPKAL